MEVNTTKKSILIVEDDADIQAVVQNLLMQGNYDVVSAENGQVAIAKLESGLKPDIVLLDLMMPKMSGYSLLNELHHRGLHTTFSLLVMSADVLTRQQIERMGIKGFISKPFDIDELQAMIDALQG